MAQGPHGYWLTASDSTTVSAKTVVEQITIFRQIHVQIFRINTMVVPRNKGLRVTHDRMQLSERFTQDRPDTLSPSDVPELSIPGTLTTHRSASHSPCPSGPPAG